MRQVPFAHVLFHNVVALEQAFHVFDERDDAHALRVKLTHPVLDGLTVYEHLVFMADDHLLVVGLNQRNLFPQTWSSGV